jgi:hypothetical protein
MYRSFAPAFPREMPLVTPWQHSVPCPRGTPLRPDCTTQADSPIRVATNRGSNWLSRYFPRHATSRW